MFSILIEFYCWSLWLFILDYSTYTFLQIMRNIRTSAHNSSRTLCTPIFSSITTSSTIILGKVLSTCIPTTVRGKLSCGRVSALLNTYLTITQFFPYARMAILIVQGLTNSHERTNSRRCRVMKRVQRMLSGILSRLDATHRIERNSRERLLLQKTARFRRV